MLDIKSLRHDLPSVINKLLRRGFHLDQDSFLRLEETRKALQVRAQELQNERNITAKLIGAAKNAGADTTDLLAKAGLIASELPKIEQELEAIQNNIEAFLLNIPNIPQDTVQVGKSSEENTELRRMGQIQPKPFIELDHTDLGSKLGMDFESAAKIAGSRFVVLKGQLARLHRALIQFMLDVHTQEHGYTECYVPYLANIQSLIGTGQLPKFSEDLFALKGEWGYHLIPTAEVPVTNLVRGNLINLDELPLKWVAHTPCFRSEAGSYGRDTRGMIRQHQFEKVELVQIVRPEDSNHALETLTGHAENILKKLELPYRVVALCTGDLGFASAKTYDLEVWLPGQKAYREISSCSNFEAFQARRLSARCKDRKTKKIDFVHTLNGSGLAVGRTLVAVLENYQEADGSITVPAVLAPYMGATKSLHPGIG